MLFGIFGTITSFIIFSALTSWLMSRSNAQDGVFLWQTNYSTGESIPVDLSTNDILMMCALLCSTDVIAAISMVSYDKYPRLFSLLFGESVVNDAVTIILFNTIGSLKDVDMGKSTVPLMFGQFILLASLSLCIGIIYGAATALILKNFRVLARDAISECIFLFSMGYLSYATSERLN